LTKEKETLEKALLMIERRLLKLEKKKNKKWILN
jgi:hypothetical protein